MPSIEHFPKPHNQEVFNDLHDVGLQDPIFGDTGELDGRDHEQELQAALLAVAQAAHDQVIGHGKQDYLSATGERIDIASGLAYAHDPMTNTAYMIGTSAMEDGDMKLRITTATGYDKKAQEPAFYRRHKIGMVYRADGSVEESRTIDEGMRTVNTTTSIDAKDPSAFLEMAASISRASAINRRQFERLDKRSRDELISGQVGRMAAVRTIFGMKPNGKSIHV